MTDTEELLKHGNKKDFWKNNLITLSDVLEGSCDFLNEVKTQDSCSVKPLFFFIKKNICGNYETYIDCGVFYTRKAAKDFVKINTYEVGTDYKICQQHFYKNSEAYYVLDLIKELSDKIRDLTQPSEWYDYDGSGKPNAIDNFTYVECLMNDNKTILKGFADTFMWNIKSIIKFRIIPEALWRKDRKPEDFLTTKQKYLRDIMNFEAEMRNVKND